MSQITFLQGSDDIIPVEVPIEFVTGNGTTAIADNHILNTLGGGLPIPAVINDNDNGIDSYADPDLSNNLKYFLTNRKVGTATTSGAVTEDLFTQNLGGQKGVYNFQVYVSAFSELPTPAGAAYTIFGSVRTTGSASTLIVTQDIISDEEADLLGADFQIVADGAGNNLIARATGVAGRDINFKVLANYIFVGA